MPKINKIWAPVSNAMQCLDDGLSFVQIQPIPNFNFISSQDWNLSVGWIKDQDSDGVLFTQPNSAGGIIPIEIAIKTHALVLSIGSWYKKRQISCGDFLIPEGENRLDLSYQHLPDSKVQISLFLNCILVFQSAVFDVDSISNTEHYQSGLNFSGLITNIRVVNLALGNSAVAQNLYVNHFEREKILLYLDFSQLSPKDQGKYALDYQGEYKARHVNYLATRKFTQDTYLKSQRSLKLENSWTILAKVYWDDHFRPYQVIAQLVAGNASSYEKLADTPAPTTSQPATLELAVVGGKLAIRLANQQIVLDQPFSQSQWMDICLSVDGISSSNNSKVQLFVNGELVQQTSLTPLPALGGTLIIGNSATYSESNDHYWGGFIDSVAIFQTNFGQATAQSYLDIPPYVLDEHIMNFFTVYELYDHARIAAMAQIGSLPTTYALNTYPEIESSTFQFREPEQELVVDNFVAWQARMLLDAVSANLSAFTGLGLASEETSNYSNAIINRVGVNLFYGASRFRDSANRLTDPDDPDNVTTLMVDLDAVPKSYRLELGYLATGSKISPGILLAAALLVGCFLVASSCTTVVAKGGIAGIALIGLLALGALVTVVIVQCIKDKPDKTDDKIPVAPGYDDLEPYDVKNFFLKSLTFYAGETSKTSSFAVKQSFDQLSKLPEWEVGESTHGVVLYAKQYHSTPKVTATFDFNRKVKDMPITTLNVTVKGSSTLGGSNYPVMGQLTGTVLVSGPGTYTVNLQSDADFKNAPLGKILSAMDWTFTTDEPVRYEGGASKVDVYVIQAQPVSPWSVNSSSPDTLLFKDFLDVYNQVIASDRSIELSRENIVPIALKEPRFRLAPENVHQFGSITYEMVEEYKPRTAKVEFKLQNFLLEYQKTGIYESDAIDEISQFSVSTFDSAVFWNLLLRANGVETTLVCLRATECSIEDLEIQNRDDMPIVFEPLKAFAATDLSNDRILSNHFLLGSIQEVSTKFDMTVSDVALRSFKNVDSADGVLAQNRIFSTNNSYFVVPSESTDVYNSEAYREIFVELGSCAMIYATAVNFAIE